MIGYCCKQFTKIYTHTLKALGKEGGVQMRWDGDSSLIRDTRVACKNLQRTLLVKDTKGWPAARPTCAVYEQTPPWAVVVGSHAYPHTHLPSHRYPEWLVGRRSVSMIIGCTYQCAHSTAVILAQHVREGWRSQELAARSSTQGGRLVTPVHRHYTVIYLRGFE